MGGFDGLGGPDMAPQTPPSATRSSRGLDRSGQQCVSLGEPRAAAGKRSVPSGEREVVVVTGKDVGGYGADLSGHERDTLVLTAEERQWGRRRVTTTRGRTLALALPTGTTLTLGEILHVGPDWYLIVEGAPEPVLAVTPASREEALRIAFEVGNRHFTLALDGERLLVPDDAAMDQLLTRLGASFERAQAVFVPLGRGHRHDG